jgi:hypothetical protein
MDSITKQLKYCRICIHWVAGIYGILLAAFVLTIFIGEGFFYPGDGLPNPFTQPLPVAIELFGTLAVLIGCIIGWKWRGLGAILVIGGITTFHIIEKRLWLMGAFPLCDLAGILFLFSWCAGRPWKNARIKKA